jgi:NAD(P)-dependent dehydrogenase (short-subunit alcohol dehydrogenase family)
MNRKTVLVTGSSDGIGKQTALELAKMGARVIMHGRDAGRTRTAVEEVRAATGAEADFVLGDYTSLMQVRQMAKDVLAKTDHLDVLVNNAGVYMLDRQMTGDGFEMSWQVNHLAPYLLTTLLLDCIKNSPPARIVNVASVAHNQARLDYENLQGEKEFKPYRVYCLSKLGNVMATLDLAEKLASADVTVNCLHPGVVETKLLRTGFSMQGTTLENGVQTSLFLATSPSVEGVTGKYFDDCREVAPSPVSLDAAERRRFMDVTDKMLGL